ncbi:DNA polymerase epsilon subunit C [Neolecta irregularis DAH-3]|uniref:DNA polymerase epsilon subunit C n=1 Tax=Neolecta irregularis (strain DAH-3) TaxID=1198029 RepID=A0A1U7LJM8_NEOID|nr:DNA polymerase epsilon subunit C [Neolecta irregularis DAH-3]|eukprot:OLL22838.1 DNA polymerase epsilon subunit C [Neolecta irregularis DAH-3]
MASRRQAGCRFPVARIKKIMQADEDVGKVAQVAPVIVSKALELFMQSIIGEACKETRDAGAKKVTVTHMKQAILKTEQFDFLVDIIEKYPDPMHQDDGTDDNGHTSSGRGRGRGRGRGHGRGAMVI